MLNYLKDYGNIRFEDVPLNDVDRLVFAQAAYLNFSSAAQVGETSLADALQHVDFERTESATERRFAFQQKDDRALCNLLLLSRRYAGMRFIDFQSALDSDAAGQFAVLSLLLPDGTLLIAFRGTDNTLAGWREDFDLAWKDEVPAQRMARQYVDRIARLHPYIELCGHSKGGNLAFYSAVTCADALENRLRSAVSFDGPGLSRRLAESPEFLRTQPKMRLLRPRASLVGLLFHQPEQVRLVECSTVSILQHYPYSWKTLGMDFQYAQTPTAMSLKLGQTVCGFLDRMPVDLREQFIETTYEIIAATGAETLNDLVHGWIRNTPAVVRKLRSVDPETCRLLLPVLKAFWRSVADALGIPMRDETP